MERHKCDKFGWSICCVCQGRIHLAGCTSRPNKQKDCCKARHVMLYDQGHRVGLDDSSQPMLTSLQKWAHEQAKSDKKSGNTDPHPKAWW
jgi:hypothetical protein